METQKLKGRLFYALFPGIAFEGCLSTSCRRIEHNCNYVVLFVGRHRLFGSSPKMFAISVNVARLC